MQKQSTSLEKGWGSVMPNSPGSVAVGLFLPPLPCRAQDPPAGLCQGFVRSHALPWSPGHPRLPTLSPYSHSLFSHVLLFILQTLYAKSNLTAGSAPRVCFLCLRGARQLRLRHGSEVEAAGGGEQGCWGGKREQAAACQALICLKLKPV